jgi:S-adenosylmethionine decarboxylase
VHLVIDGHGCDPAQLSDKERVLRFLDTYPDAIGMTKVTPPSVYTYQGPTPEDWGVSGFVIIAESHISVHTFPDRGYINVDVFSCKKFDADRALAEIAPLFAMGEVKHWVLDRGLEHLDPAVAKQAVEAEREALYESPSAG